MCAQLCGVRTEDLLFLRVVTGLLRFSRGLDDEMTESMGKGHEKSQNRRLWAFGATDSKQASDKHVCWSARVGYLWGFTFSMPRRGLYVRMHDMNIILSLPRDDEGSVGFVMYECLGAKLSHPLLYIWTSLWIRETCKDISAFEEIK